MPSLYTSHAYSQPPIDSGVPSFDQLLPYDPLDVEKLNCSRRSGHGRTTSDVTLLSEHIGLAGPERHLVLDEVRRVRQAKGRTHRRREAILAGLVTGIIFVVCAYFSIAAAISLAQLEDESTRSAFAVAQLATYLPSCVILVLLLVWLRLARGPSAGSYVALAGAMLVFLVLFVQSVINLVLVSLQLNQFTARCSVGIDFVWTLYASGQACDPLISSRTENWTIAASLRLLITTALTLLWLYSLRRFVRALSTAVIVDPAAEPALEVQAIFARRGVSIISLDAPWAPHPDGKEGQLPAMPERDAAREEPKSWFWSTVDWLLGRHQPESTDEERPEIYVDRPLTPPVPYLTVDIPRGPSPIYRELFDEKRCR